MLKTYPSSEFDTYDTEVNTYTALMNTNDSAHILGYLGSYYTLSPDGNGAIYTIILEHADRGTLLDLYMKNEPPLNFDETKAFWKELCTVVFGLEVFHHTPPHGSAGTSCVHQDLKPSNVFIFSRQPENGSVFNIQVKIGDLGLSNVRKLGSRGDNRLGYASKSSRTYSSPELYLKDDVEYSVHPKNDVWSIGCVILEAAVWVAFGERGRTEFQNRRRAENDRKNPDQKNMGSGDSFHNGIDRLDTVADAVALIDSNGRKSDDLTPAIARMILDNALCWDALRSTAGQLSTKMKMLMANPREMISSPHRGPRVTQNCRDARQVYGPEPIDTHNSHMSDPPTPIQTPFTNRQAWPISGHHSQSSPVDNGQSFSTRAFSVHGHNDLGHTPEANDSLSSDPWSIFTPHLAVPQIQIASQFGAPVSPDVQSRHKSRGQSQDWSMLHGVNPRLPETGSRQSLKSGVSSQEEEELLGGESRHRRTDISPSLGAQQQAAQQSIRAEPCSSAGRVQTEYTTISNRIITPKRRPQEQNPFPTEARPTFPIVKIEEVDELRLKGKVTKQRLHIRGEDQAMPLLRKRDHVSSALLMWTQVLVGMETRSNMLTDLSHTGVFN